MITRREFIKYTAVAGAATTIPGALKLAGAMAKPRSIAATPALAPWVDEMPAPGVYTPVGTHTNGAPLYEVAMSQATQQLHRDLPATAIWGYGGATPGNTFVVRTGGPIAVKWVDNLPATHLLAASIDRTLPGIAGLADVRTTVHLHGSEVDAQYDGGPFSWFPPGESRIYEYENVQQASTLWYHDHALGITRLNVVAGLAGFYLIFDDVEDSLNLPKLPYDMGIVFQDRTFTAGGAFDYPTVGNVPAVHPQWVPEFFGDTIMVNGKITPYLRVEPRRYRIRFLDGSQARFYNMSLSNGMSFFIIASEGGLFAAPVEQKQLLISPGERYEAVVDFTGLAGQTLYIQNDAPAPFPGGGDVAIPQLLQIRVDKPLSGTDTSEIPSTLRPFYELPEGSSRYTRDIVLQEVVDAGDNPLNLALNGMGVMDPVTDRPSRGTVEIWRLINTTGDTHPIHTHLIMFQVIDRRPYDVNAYLATNQIVFTGPPIPADPWERGWKDTVRAWPGQVTRVIARFQSFTGGYVYHCHILEHEENDMMRPYEVLPTTYFFAEGTCRPNFVPYITIQNPGETDAKVKVTYMKGDGTTKEQTLTVGKTSRTTIAVKDILGEGDDPAHDFSARVETTNGTQVIVERPMYFNFKGMWTGGSCTVGSPTVANTFYFAEGTCRPDFETYLCIQNPDPNNSSRIKITYMLVTGDEVVHRLTVPKNSRVTVIPRDSLGTGNDAAHDFATKVETTNDVPIVAERTMYFNYGGKWTGGHAVVGALGPADAWYFAEGTCRPNFDTYITLQNPGESPSSVKLTYLKGDGTTKEQTISVSANSRATVIPRDSLGTGDDAAHDFSTKVETTNGVPIVAERSMYFNYGGKWTGGHCVVGAFTPAKAWFFAEGTCRPGFDPYICIQNPNPKVDAKVTISYMRGDGTTKDQLLTVPAGSRMTVAVKDQLGEADDAAHDFSAKVASTNGVWIVAERAMYFNYKNIWTGGTCVMGFMD